MRSRKKWFFLGVGPALVLAFAIAFTGLVRDVRAINRQIMCVHQLHVLALPLRMYADDHEGRFPDEFSALYPIYVTDLQWFVCPALYAKYNKERGVPHPFTPDPTPEEIDSLSSYVLVRGLSASDDKDNVFAYEMNDNHSGTGHSLVYLDGRGAWEPLENWRDGRPASVQPVRAR